MSENSKIVRLSDATSRYPMRKATLRKTAAEAGALIRVRRMLFVDTEAMDRFMESKRVPVK